ncbi:FAD-binding oxidoreductase [Caldinitratiruptor microaerophilus]|nr:FAD-linked oxidase C-terminal domain-containing protein [Caldinitratiruptor microaerophilus]
MAHEDVIRELQAIVGPRWVLHRPEDLLAYECDGYTLERRPPLAVVQPDSTEEVSRVLRALHRRRIPFIPRGAGTGLSGGAIPQGGEVVISLTRMNRLLEVDVENQRAVVQPGHVNLHLTQKVQGHGYYYAPDPSSQYACTLGGNVAENAGGPHCLKYGVTMNHVLGLTLVLPDGEVVRLGGKAWDYPGYDLVGLVVGSEGTMGVVTEIVVRLLRRPQAVKTCLALFDTVEDASRTVSGITARGIIPAALELMDRLAIDAVEKGNFPVGYPPDIQAVLIAEVDGLAAGLDDQMERIVAVCRENNVREVRVARTDAERALWWNNRKTAFGAMGKLAPDYYVQDGVIPRSKLTEVLRRIDEISREYGLPVANVFHAGDGNLHPLVLYDRRQPGVVEKVVKAGSAILKACVDAGGTISGEHGIGIEKREDMRLVFTQADLDAQSCVREVFDPDGLANPGKLLPSPARCVDIRALPVAGAAGGAGRAG